MDISSVVKPAAQTVATHKAKPESQQTPPPENKASQNAAANAASATTRPVVNTQGHVTGRHLNVSA